MATSKSRKKFFQMVYGIGASIVIIGALFKIAHWPNGTTILAVGMIVEAIVFFISAFEPIEDEFDWSLLYDEIKKNSLSSNNFEAKLSEKLDKMLQEAKVDSDLMSRLGQSLNKFAEAAKGLDVVVDAAGSTQKFNEEMLEASAHLEGLNQIFKNQLEVVDRNVKANEEVALNSEELKEKMAQLNQYMAKLNEVYQGMLSAMGK
ncbi:MAG: gliding motility protein GldL [Chlorobi bacterium]|nr:gliding motility protein GldL [Chlorobiota bacterium]